MTRFFFDYTAKEQSLLDYGGHEFRSSQGLEFAERLPRICALLTGELR